MSPSAQEIRDEAALLERSRARGLQVSTAIELLSRIALGRIAMVL
jgi:hypothetical protein